MLAAWLALFQFLGNSTFGYSDTSSMFRFLWSAYNSKSDAADDSHGNVVPFVVLGLIWWKRKELINVELKSWMPGLLLLTLATAMHVMSYLVQQPRISVLAMIAGVYAIMGMAWGPKWLRRIVFPFALFLFSVPLADQGQRVTFPLRMLVSGIAEFVGRNVMGMDLVREGTQFTNSAHAYAFDVAAACSGIRSLMAIFFICTAYGYVLFRRSWRWPVMMAAAFPLAVIGNTVRLLVVLFIAAHWGKEAGEWAHDNMYISMLPYVPAILGVIFLARWLEAKPKVSTAEVKP